MGNWCCLIYLSHFAELKRKHHCMTHRTFPGNCLQDTMGYGCKISVKQYFSNIYTIWFWKSWRKVKKSESVSHLVMSDSFATPWTLAHQAPLSVGILQARLLEWVAIPFSRGSSWPRDWTCFSCSAGRFFTIWTTGEAPYHLILEILENKIFYLHWTLLCKWTFNLHALHRDVM